VVQLHVQEQVEVKEVKEAAQARCGPFHDTMPVFLGPAVAGSADARPQVGQNCSHKCFDNTLLGERHPVEVSQVRIFFLPW
jgi:hypothetical protein